MPRSAGCRGVAPGARAAPRWAGRAWRESESMAGGGNACRRIEPRRGHRRLTYASPSSIPCTTHRATSRVLPMPCRRLSASHHQCSRSIHCARSFAFEWFREVRVSAARDGEAFGGRSRPLVGIPPRIGGGDFRCVAVSTRRWRPSGWRSQESACPLVIRLVPSSTSAPALPRAHIHGRYSGSTLTVCGGSGTRNCVAAWGQESPLQDGPTRCQPSRSRVGESPAFDVPGQLPGRRVMFCQAPHVEVCDQSRRCSVSWRCPFRSLRCRPPRGGAVARHLGRSDWSLRRRRTLGAGDGQGALRPGQRRRPAAATSSGGPSPQRVMFGGPATPRKSSGAPMPSRSATRSNRRGCAIGPGRDPVDAHAARGYSAAQVRPQAAHGALSGVTPIRSPPWCMRRTRQDTDRRL